MRLACPHCGAVAGADAWENDATVRQCLRIVAELPRDVSLRAVGYLALWRPIGGRGLSWAKALRVLGEIKVISAETTLSWKRQPARAVSPWTWGAAMERMIAAPPRDLPLDGHGYLRAIAYGLADEADRGAEAAQREAERNGSARACGGGGSGEPVGSDDAKPVMTPEQIHAAVAQMRGRVGKSL